MTKTKTFSFTLAALSFGVVALAGIAFAANNPTSPVGHWALNEGAGVTAEDSTANNNDGVISGASYTSVGIPATPGNDFALTFDGVDDFVTVPNAGVLDMTAAYSASAWVNVTDIATYRPILYRGTTNANDIEIYVQSGTGDLIVAHNRGNGGTFDYVGFAPPSVGSLFHLAVVFDGTNVQAYYNGVAAAVTQQTTAVDAPLATGKPWMMGKVDHSAYGGGGVFYFSGLLDEVLLYDRALSAGEVTFLATTGGTTHMVDDDGIVGLDLSCDGTGVDAFTTVQAGVNAANTGETVYVCSGTYAENVTLSKDINLHGRQVGVDARGRVASEAIIAPAAGIGIELDTGVAGATIDGFTFAGGGRGIESDTGPLDGLTIQNNRFLPAAGQSGVFLNDSGIDISLDQNSFQGADVSSTLVHLDQDGFDGLWFTNNDVIDGGGTGLFVDGNHNIGVSINRSPKMTGNVFDSNGTGANLGRFAFEFGDISDNTFKNNTFDGLQGGIQNSTITENTFDNNARSGLALTGFGGAGDATRGAQNNSITLNTFVGNDTEGVFLSTGQFPGTISTNVINRNGIAGNVFGLRYAGTETINAECNWWGDASGPNDGVGIGTGDTVGASATIDFNPWLTTSDLVSDPCDGPLPTLIVEKIVTNDNGGTATTSDFALFIDGFPTTSGAATTTSEGVHVVSETNLPGYTATIGGDCDADGNVILGPDDIKTCTITNDDQPASLTLQKVVVNDNGGTATPANWTMTASGPTGFSGFGPSVTNATVDAGAYDLSESGGPTGYDASDWSCVDNGGGGGPSPNFVQDDEDTVTLAPGDDVTCTITNDDQPAKLIVIKHVINDNGGTALASAFTLDSGGTDDSPDNFAGAESPGTTVTLDAGSYSVTETGPAGYTQSNSADCSGTIAIGETKTCTITNDDVPPPPANACATPLVAPPGYTLQNGTAGSNFVTLAPFTMFVGNGGNDTVVSNKNGNYIVCTLGGNDFIRLSGAGAVTIDAGNGRNTVVLGNMTGFITTGTGVDTISAGNGARTINAGDGKNTVTTGGGDQMITTGSGDDNIFTNGGNDTINAGAGKNKVFSKGGSDSLTALGGNDFFDAGPGADTCSAGGGSNTVLNCAP